MKSVKVLVLTLFLAVTGYSFASGTIQASSDSDHQNIAAAAMCDRTCCMGKAECCKPGAECCMPGATCCKAETRCCERDKQCCNGDECCASCADSCTASAKAEKIPANNDATSCCGSACKRTVSAKS